MIVDLLEGRTETVEIVGEAPEPYLTSTLCVYEVIEGKLGSGSTDVAAARDDFGGITALDLTEGVALEAARLRDELLAAGERMSARDALIAATARSTGDRFFVADDDFGTPVLSEVVDIEFVR